MPLLSPAVVGIFAVTGWLGREMTHRHGIGVAGAAKQGGMVVR